MHFLFRLDLSLHARAGKKFGIWNLKSKHGPDFDISRLPSRPIGVDAIVTAPAAGPERHAGS